MAINKDGLEGGSFLTYDQQVKLRSNKNNQAETKKAPQPQKPIKKEAKKEVADV